MPKKTALKASMRPKRRPSRQVGIRQAWVLPHHIVVTLGTEGDLNRWNARTGEALGEIRTPGPVRHVSLVGQTLIYICEEGKLGTYNAKTLKPIWVMQLPVELASDLPQRIERLGEHHLAVVAKPQWGDEAVHVFGPFLDLQLSAPDSKVEYGARLAEHVVLGAEVFTVSRVPKVIEPLHRGRTRNFTIDPALRTKLKKQHHRLCVAGNRLITIREAAMSYVRAESRGSPSLWVWDASARSFVESADLLDDIEGDGYLFPGPGDMDDPVVLGMLGFPSGRVLSWGLQHTHLWSATRLKMERLFTAHRLSGAFIVERERLVAWSEREGAIYYWNLRSAGRRKSKSHDEPVSIHPPQGVTGACYLGGNRLVSWTLSDPTPRVWDFVKGKFVRGFGA